MALKSDGTVYIDTRVDTKGFGKGMNSMQSQVGGLTGAFKKLGAAIGAAFAIKQLVQFSKKSIELGSDLQEVQNVVDTVFTTMSDKVDEFAKSAAETAGLSETMAKRYTGTFGAMAKAFGFAESEAFTMSTALTQLSGDVASFYNITQDEAYTKLKSVFTGETETLKDLGVVMTQSALDSFAMAEGLGKTTKQMSEQEKVALRYRFVLNQLSTASGDFLRTSDSWANQTRLLKLNIESIMATFGQGLINFFTPVIKLINTLLSKIATLANAFKAFSEMIMGTSSGGGGSGQVASELGDLEEGYGGVADGAEDAANATEKANKANKKYLSGLDEIRTFQSETKDSGNISVGGISGQPIDFGTVNTEGEKTNTIFDGIIEKAKELADIFKSGFMDGLGDFQPRLDSIKESLASIKESLIEIFTDAGVQEAANNFVNTFVYALGQVVGSIASIGLTIGTNLVGGLARYLEENKDRIKDHLVTMFDIGTEINVMIGNFASAIAYIFEAFAGENGQKLTANIIGIFVNAFMGIVELAGKFGRDVINIITKPFIEQKDKFRTAFDGMLGVFAEVTGTLKQGIDDTFAKLNEVYDQHFKPFFDSLAQGISDLTGQFLDFWNNSVQPMLDEWAAKFDVLWKEHIQPFLNNVAELLGSVADLLKVLWETVMQPVISWIIENVLPTLLPILQALYDTFIKVFGAIYDTLSGLIEVITEVINFIVAVINGDWSAAWEAAKNIVIGVFETVFSFIEATLESLIGIINVALETILGAFELTLKGLYDQVVSTWDNVKEYTSTFITWIKDNISSALDDVKEVWNTIWDSFSTKISDVWTSITDTISGAIDKIKGWVSEIMDSFSQIKSKASSLFSGGFSSIKIPSFGTSKYNVNVPKLATGSVIPPNAPFLAMLGDQRHGTNIEAPLDTIKQAVREVVGNGKGGVLHAHLYLDGKEVLTSVIDMAKLEQTATGINPLLLT